MNEPRTIDLRSIQAIDHYMIIDNRNVKTGGETNINIAVRDAANVGDIVLINDSQSYVFKVCGILEQRDHRGNDMFTFQRLKVVRE